MTVTRPMCKLWLLCLVPVLFCAATLRAQPGDDYEPLNEKLPPGFTAEVLARIRQDDRSWLQPVRVEIPGEGLVSVYSATPDPLAVISAPAQFSVNTGHVYRLRVSEMPEFPGIEIYPSIEILDRLHPPQGTARHYPIPIVLTKADLKEAIDGQLVTRVIYLEDSRKAAMHDPLRLELSESVEPTQNALQHAGALGRPMIIVRIGGRIPLSNNMPLSFYGTGGAFDLGESLSIDTGMVRMNGRGTSRNTLANQRR